MLVGSRLAAAIPRRSSQRTPRCLTRRLTAGSPFGQPRGWLSRSARLAQSRLVCRRESIARRAKSGVGASNRHLPRDNVPRRLHALSMRWVVMLFVILAAVMGGEAGAVVVDGAGGGESER